MKRLIAIATALAVPGALVIAMAAPTTASSGGTVIRYLSTNAQNTDINVGEEEGEEKLSPGDRQVFSSDAVRDGKKIGEELGEALTVQVTEDGNGRLIAFKGTLTTTLVLANGTVTMTGAFIEEDTSQGPVGFTTAVTGGTGRYKGASGQAVGKFVPNTNDVKMTIRLQ